MMIPTIIRMFDALELAALESQVEIFCHAEPEPSHLGRLQA